MLRTYAVCEECEDSETPYGEVQDPDFNYSEIVDEGEPKFDEIDGWTVKGVQDPDDPICVELEFYCPDCSAKDAIYDSGDTA